jgi:GPH family glycoside/pentoside/hexuronide:cation symporter
LKAGTGLGAAAAGFILSTFGYVSGGVSLQSPSAIYGIRLAASLIPAILFIVCVCVMYFYPITLSFNEKMQKELEDRRSHRQFFNDQL